MTARLRVGVLFGGRSGEHEVSVMSARGIVGALDPDKYDAVLVGIDRAGSWQLLPPEVFSTPPTEAAQEVVGQGALQATREVVPSELVGGQGHPSLVDVFFPIVHGSQGEDGCLQGLLEMIGAPYVGCGVLGSAVGMDKDVSKRLLRESGLPVVECVVARAGRASAQQWVDEVERKFGYPCFVKPANLGSSVGIAKAYNTESLVAAIDNAFRYDEKLVIERGVNAREIELAVLAGEPVRVSVPGEVVPRHEFYSYEAKYLDANGAELLVPAPLTKEQVEHCQGLARQTFECLELEGLARVDFFLDRDSGEWLVNEVNTLPGFTEISMYARMWQRSGVSYRDLLGSLIDLGLARYERRRGLEVSRE